MNIPVCMMTSVGGTAMMLTVNGITWLRMFSAYRRHRSQQPGRLGPFWTFDRQRSAMPRTASLVDTQLYVVAVLGCIMLMLPWRIHEHAPSACKSTATPSPPSSKPQQQRCARRLARALLPRALHRGAGVDSRAPAAQTKRHGDDSERRCGRG